MDLHEALPRAIRKCRITAAFLSVASVRSDWVRQELEVALEFEDRALQRVVPVFLGDPTAILAGNERLRDRWLSPERNQLSKFALLSEDARVIAEGVARAAFDLLDWKGGTSPGIVIDQRGMSGRRAGRLPPETVPDRLLRSEGPVLVFRPDDGERSPGETLHGDEWTTWWADVRWGLTELRRRAPGGLRELRIAGAGQLGMGWALGCAFDRTSRVDMLCFPRPASGEALTNRGQDFVLALTGGNPDCAGPGLPPLPDGDLPEIDLILAPANRLPDIAEFRGDGSPPAVWIPTGLVTDSAQAMALVRDVVALLGTLAQSRRTRHARIFTALPFHFLPLLSANLTHVIDRTTFMDYHRARAGATYVPIEV